MGSEPPIADLQAESAHTALRLARYRRRLYLGRVEPGRLAEYERAAEGAAERLRRAEQRAAPPTRSPT
jgi:hypothetical protein